MVSIIPGFEYDIFISYRQKDNKYDGWVSEFVNHLKGELESTFKEDISIYFDENPHDRLQETYNVDKSLEGKLKCLIFIPIISQTYCDPKSYAWQSEFLPFNRIASEDQFGRDIKLRNGNVASRIFPVRIHDLDTDDVKLFEKETGSVMRAVDFVFKTSSGVNRPLRVNEDHPNDNLNKTFYRDQINKTANAIKEIIGGLRLEQPPQVKEKIQIEVSFEEAPKEEKKIELEIPASSTKRKLLSRAIISGILIIIIVILAYSKLFHTGKNKIAKDPDGRISLAVNTFDNLTGDTTLNAWRDGISELLIGNLGSSKELSVQNSQTMYEVYQSMGQSKHSSLVPSLSREAAMKLKSGAYITGSYHKTGNKIRIQLKLIDTKSDELLWTGKVDGDLNSDYIDLTDSLSKQVKNFLEIKALEKSSSQDFRDAFTNSADAYRKYIEGMNSFMNSDYLSAIQSYKEALKIDSTFTLAAFYIAYTNSTIGTAESYRQASIWTQKAYAGKEKLPENYQLWLEMTRAFYFTKNSNEILTYLNALESSNIKSRLYWFDIGITYASEEIYDKAVKPFEKIESISSEWGVDWKFLQYYTWFGLACHHTGDHKKEAKIFETGLNLFPDNPWLIFGQAKCAISQGDSARASELVKELIEISKKSGASEITIESGLGLLYLEAESFDKAEEHYRRALKLSPSNVWRIGALANCLIRYDRNVEEGMKLVNKGLESYPGHWFLLSLQGQGLYKQGKYEEADSVLLVAKDSLPTWSYPLNKQIQDVKNALAKNK
jgi:tetratricopeptide (TPR) repeat protein